MLLKLILPIYGTNKSTPGNRPVQEKLGIKHRGLSTKVTRALTDFGSEESFGQAAKRFEEHARVASKTK